ncbi:MAG: hypothetical protein CMH57_11220 [Myxococcales bacterium]|nr:hypothetical protein [Myxococcales bacterium]
MPVSASQKHDEGMHSSVSNEHTSPRGQPVSRQPAGLGPSQALSSGTQIPPPQSSVQIHRPVASSHEQLDAMHSSWASEQVWPRGQPFWWQPAGLGPSQAPGSAQVLP